MTVMHDGDDLTAEIRRSSLGVMAFSDDPIEELAAGAELHDEVDGVLILVSSLELDDVAMAGEVVHDLDLTADVFDVVVVDELAGGDGFAGELLLVVLVGDEVGDAELAAAELAAKGVGGADVFHGAAEDAADGRRGGSSGGCGWVGLGFGWGGGIGREDPNAAVRGAVLARIRCGGVLGGGQGAAAAVVAHFGQFRGQGR